MTEAADATVWLDAAAGPMVRPYTMTGGRTRATTAFNLITLVKATPRPLQNSAATPEHAYILEVCQGPKSVAEISAHMHLPVAVIKILLEDLLKWRAIDTRAPAKLSMPTGFDETARNNPRILKAVLRGLERL